MANYEDEVQTRILTLNYDENLEKRVFRLQKGWKVKFVRGASLLGHGVQVYTSNSGKIAWKEDRDEFAAFSELLCEQAGAFSYNFTVDGEEKPAGNGYLLVMPNLTINGQRLSLNAVTCVTHISKLLGELPEWMQRLEVAKRSGYNMIHFTPVQKLGISNSSYCIADPLELNPSFSPKTKKFTYDDLAKFLEMLEVAHGMLSMQDVVWNHAAINAQWLLDHPECAYNLKNSPHLRSAYVLDRVLYHFGNEVMEGKWAYRGLPAEINCPEHIKTMKDLLFWDVLPMMRLEEFFQCDVNKMSEKFKTIMRSGIPENETESKLKLIPGSSWNRFGFEVDMDKASKMFNRFRNDAANEADRHDKCLKAFQDHLHRLNGKAEGAAQKVIEGVIKAVAGHVNYERVDTTGPRLKAVTKSHPLVAQYFLHPFATENWRNDELYAYNDEKAEHIMACNGWVMTSDPLRNFAAYPSAVYLKRELVCWSDCIKLNYGEKPDDCPFLWNLMKEYTQKCAQIFHGLRIDNCHSTPIHVAEYLLKAAREVRPDIYVVAELFTSDESIDNIFVNRLGITSLIREAQNAPISYEQGRFVYRFGGDTFGGFIQKPVQEAVSCVAPALFFDQTHDNPTAIKKRSVYDLIPTAAMLAMSSCAIGTVRGYDELIPSLIDVVYEKRLYTTWHELDIESSIIPAREALNKLHIWLAENNYTQVYVDQRSDHIVAITRHNPFTHEKVIMIAHTAFNKHEICHDNPNIADLIFSGVLDEVLLEIKFQFNESERQENKTRLVGLSGAKTTIRSHLLINESIFGNINQRESDVQLHFKHFPSGSIIVLKVSPMQKATKAINIIRGYFSPVNSNLKGDMESCLQSISLQVYNYILFRVSAEDESDYKTGTYEIPQWRALTYCGFQGMLPFLNNIRVNNDLGHPVCENLRNGVWLCNYIVDRLQRHENEGAKKFGLILKKLFKPLDDVPYDLRPCYFENIYSRIYEIIYNQLMKKLSPPFAKGSIFVQTLGLASLAFVGAVKDAALSKLPASYELEDSRPSSLSAGLPHFATGIWRNWGRDTFIALPGCLLVTGRFHDAEALILSYGGAMRHGLIPNLLSEGHAARYNARDAVWFWLYAIVKYIEKVPNGSDILKKKLTRIFINDDTVFGNDFTEQELHETMQEALQRHFSGISFIERNAGSQIDEHMQQPGFHVEAFIDKDKGFVCGGNEFNCGTWMDKMGSSERAGNKGEPATPRDGAAVELQGLAFAVVKMLSELHAKELYPHAGVVNEECGTWTWAMWAKKLKDNFESFFSVYSDDCSQYVNRRGIIKDLYGSKYGYTDFQLRPNFAITLAVAPELMSARNAWDALQIAQKALLGPLGIKTLDPTDWNYCAYYNQDDDGSKKSTARGFSYHQGPEWLWIAMFFYRAKLTIAKRLNDENINIATKRFVRSRMGAYWDYLKRSAWTSLPELTNGNGERCPYSCTAQAWTVGCLLETVEELYELSSE